MKFTRREFIRSVATASGATALGTLEAETFGKNSIDALAVNSGIDHIVVVMMENRSFDHKLGWLPGSNGRQAGLSYRDPSGQVSATHALAPDFTGCAYGDPDHSYAGGRTQYDNGAMDGFLLDENNDVYAIGYYRESDLPFFSALARHYTTCDRFFCSFLGPTFPNRFFMHSAQTDRLDDSLKLATMPTIWDRLMAANVSATYYYNNLPFLALWGTKYLPIAKSYPQFLTDALTGNLPSVAFVDPRFTLVDNGRGNDDHPHADPRRGDAFLAETFFALARGPKWANTILIITYDEWGGFFDHVPPPRAAAANDVDPDVQQGKTLLGFRVPVVVASPFTVGNPLFPRVSSLTFDNTSILKLIEWRWGLQPLTPRDASNDIYNLAWILKLFRRNATVPLLPHPTAPPPTPCIGTATAIASVGTSAQTAWKSDWIALLAAGAFKNWPVYLD